MCALDKLKQKWDNVGIGSKVPQSRGLYAHQRPLPGRLRSQGHSQGLLVRPEAKELSPGSLRLKAQEEPADSSYGL